MVLLASGYVNSSVILQGTNMLVHRMLIRKFLNGLIVQKNYCLLHSNQVTHPYQLLVVSRHAVHSHP